MIILPEFCSSARSCDGCCRSYTMPARSASGEESQASDSATTASSHQALRGMTWQHKICQRVPRSYWTTSDYTDYRL